MFSIDVSQKNIEHRFIDTEKHRQKIIDCEKKNIDFRLIEKHRPSLPATTGSRTLAASTTTVRRQPH